MATFQLVNEHLGYSFHPPAEAHAMGHPQLDVIIRPTRSGEHFDPELFTCCTATTTDIIQLHVVHPWTQETAYRVCAGELIIEDARHEQVKGFTFGGTLHIQSDQHRTVCRLTSPAPLLEHTRQTATLEELLIEEVLILFAQRRAAENEELVERHLASADPLTLYHACLVTLNEKFEHFPATDDVHRRFKQFLNNATQRLENETVPSLTDLL